MAPSENNSKVFYENRYVAFLDILGFSELVRRSRDEPRLASFIAIAMGAIGINGDNPKHAIKTAAFSDCIVISAPTTPAGLAGMFGIIHTSTVALLLQVGVLSRGGVAKGLLHHGDRWVFGPAFLDAYALESTIANVPRVVVSQPVHDDFQKYKKAGGTAFPIGLKYDHDGPPFIDFLAKFASDSAHAPSEFYRMRIRAAIQAEADKAIFNPRHFEKVKWLVNYFNSRLGEKEKTWIYLPAERRPE